MLNIPLTHHPTICYPPSVLPMHEIGIDIIEIDRVGAALSRWGERFEKRVYTDAERGHCRKRVPELAVRFAAKEAVMKALGTGMKGVGLH